MPKRKRGDKVAPKMGRPIAGSEPKDKQIAFRVTATTLKKFNECSKLTGETKISLLEQMVDALYDSLTKN